LIRDFHGQPRVFGSRVSGEIAAPLETQIYCRRLLHERASYVVNSGHPQKNGFCNASTAPLSTWIVCRDYGTHD
jgi:hypothetical protein